MSELLLETKSVSKRFGGLLALDNVDLDVRRGEIHALIGPNGAGKTTLLNILTRISDPSAGAVNFDGHDLLRWRVHEIIGLGIGRLFQHVELFSSLNALENLVIGAHSRGRAGLLSALLRSPASCNEQERYRTEAREVLELVGLEDYAELPVSLLSAGQSRLMGLARALMSKPRLLLIDEVAAGLNSEETKAVARLIQKLRDDRVMTILVVEHDMRFVMSTADRITVLNFGHRIACGTPAQITSNEAVIEAYLGRRRDDA